MTYDVVTVGEAMLRLSPPHHQLIEQAAVLEVHVGGSESNVAVALARLGWRTAWVSRLTSNSIGRRIAGAIRGCGVDVTQVQWTDADRNGIYYLEDGPAPRGSRVIYDRAGSAMSRMSPHELPQDLFQPGKARLLHTSGITLAIGAPAAETARTAVRLAKEAGWLVSFDVNHRQNLWSSSEAQVACGALIRAADVIFIALRDAVTLYETSPLPDTALRDMHHRFPDKHIVMTLGAEGAVSITSGGDIAHQAAFPVSGPGRVGGGDAFAAGYLSAYLEGCDQAAMLAWGVAAAAYKYTLPGDMPLLDREAVAAILDGQVSGLLQR